jgi:hypothetical protein
MGNVYKYILSPDISMKDCFDAAYGAKEPNRPVKAAKKKFRGLLRKRIFISLVEDKLPVHAYSPDPGLDDALNAPTPDLRKLEKVPLAKWEDVQFSKLKMAERYKNVKLRTNDKSSANDMSEPPQVEISSYNPRWLSGEASESVAKVRQSKSNDVLAALSEGSKLDPHIGFRRFRSLVHEHRKVEKRIMSEKGLAHYMDISSEDMAKEILNDEKLYYTVNTEPKEGEFHKPAGRLFYMATRDMKGFVSSVERLCRTLFHGQVGNSIVSSFMKKEEQLRTMARSTSYKSEEFDLYFVSFDMSEFSKKFPMELVNEIGELFAELTGDEELSRLDVVFRAGVVVHSTRGFEGVFAGVKGGFEGFFNFVWTAAHVVIMELALLNTQKQGLVMAYSDDGLLEFIVNKNLPRSERKNIIERIQKTYSDLGLVFHLVKTLVATNIFEYLGLVAKDGRYIDSWGKSLSNMGVREQRSAFTPFMDSIDTLVGQAGAVVEALAPVDLVYYHMMMDILMVINRRHSRMTDDQAMVVALIPRSMGGLGVPSQLGLSVTDERSSIESFLHQASIMMEEGSDYMARAIEIIIENEADKDTLERDILSGSQYSANIPRIDPSPIMSRLAEIAASKAGLREVPDPMTRSLKKCLIRVLRSFKNMPVSLFSQLIETSPKFQRYRSSLEMATSRGAFTYIGRAEVRGAQAQDSRRVRTALAFWYQNLSIPPARGHTSTLSSLIRRINTIALHYGLAPIRFRPESIMVLSRDPRNAFLVSMLDTNVVELLNNPSRVKKLDDSVFNVPNMTSGLPDRTPIFDTVEGIDQSLPDRMVKVIGRMITICPEGLNNILFAVSALGAKAPHIPAGLKGEISRLRALLKGKPSVVVRMPQTLFALTTIHQLAPLSRASWRNEVTDYSSHILMAKVISGIYHYRTGELRRKPSFDVKRIFFKLAKGATIKMMLFEPPVGVRSLIDDEYQIDSLRDDSRASGIMNLITEMKLRASIIALGPESAEIRSHVVHTISNRLAQRVMFKLKRLPTRIILDERFLTDDERVNAEIVTVAYLEVARLYLKSSPTDQIAEKKSELLQLASDLEEELPAFMNQPSLRGLLLDGTLDAYTAANDIATLVSIGSRDATVVGDINDPKVYREVVSSSISKLYKILFERSNELAWNSSLSLGDHGQPVLIKSSKRNSAFTVDEILDGLVALRCSLRPSSHRASPYNQTTYQILLCKLMLIAADHYGRHTHLSRESARSVACEMSLSERHLALLLPQFGRTLGPDHQVLLRSPLGSDLGNRLAIYMRLQPTRRPRRFNRPSSDLHYSHIVRSTRALQHFLHNAISRYLAQFVVQIPTETLRSTELTHITSGLWQFRHINVATVGRVPVSDKLEIKRESDLIAAQAFMLMRRVRATDVPIIFNIPLPTSRFISLGCAASLGLREINVSEGEILSEKEGDFQVSPYPGEEEHQAGESYYISLHSDAASPLVGYLSRLSSICEIVGDISMTQNGYRLTACFTLLTTDYPDQHSSSPEEDASSNISLLSELLESDARLISSSTLDIAAGRRLAEAGLTPGVDDPLEVNPSILLAGNTGIGASRRGAWEGRVVSGEIGLAAANYHAHPAGTPHGQIVGSAMAWSALRQPPNATPEQLWRATLEKIHLWSQAIATSPISVRNYVRMGVVAEISEILSWLRHQNFHLPVEEDLPPELMSLPQVDTSMLHTAVNRIVLSRFSTLEFPIHEVRRVARNSQVFSTIADTLAPALPSEPLPHGIHGRVLRLVQDEGHLSDIDDSSDLGSDS